MGLGQGSVWGCQWVLSTDLWLLLQLLLFQVSREVPPAPLGLGGRGGQGWGSCGAGAWGGHCRQKRDLPPRLTEGLKSCLAGQLVGGQGHGTARRETLASGQHSSQIRP